jgi:hypothetical protein
MDIGTKKLTLIEKILKIENESVLSAVEKLLVTPRKPIADKNSRFSKFSGIWSNQEADEFEQIISSNCEQIDLNDWK